VAEMSDQAIDKLLAAAREVGGDAWPLLVKWQFVSGLSMLLMGLLVAGGGTALVWWGWQVKARKRYDEDLWPLPVFIGTITFVVGAFTVAWNLASVIAPDAAAVATLIH